jgi:hypothetical protein
MDFESPDAFCASGDFFVRFSIEFGETEKFTISTKFSTFPLDNVIG